MCNFKQKIVILALLSFLNDFLLPQRHIWKGSSRKVAKREMNVKRKYVARTLHVRRRSALD